MTDNTLNIDDEVLMSDALEPARSAIPAWLEAGEYVECGRDVSDREILLLMQELAPVLIEYGQEQERKEARKRVEELQAAKKLGPQWEAGYLRGRTEALAAIGGQDTGEGDKA